MPGKEDHKKHIKLIGKALKKGKDTDLIDLNKSIDFNTNIHFHKMEDLLNETGGKLPPFRLFHYIIAFFTQGSGIKTIGSFTFDVQPNMAVIIPRNVIHSTGKSKQISGYTISFQEDLFNQINLPLSFLELNKLFHYTRKPYIKTSPEVSKEIIGLFEDISTLKNSGDIFSEKMLGVKLIELILLYHKLFNTTNESINKTDFLFDQFVNLVEMNFRNSRNIEWYAEKVAVNPGHLNKTIQKHTGNSAKYFIQNRVLFEAKYLLVATKAPVKEIAFDLGFEDYNYFCRHFKKYIGCTPGQFRQRQE